MYKCINNICCFKIKLVNRKNINTISFYLLARNKLIIFYASSNKFPCFSIISDNSG